MIIYRTYYCLITSLICSFFFSVNAQNGEISGVIYDDTIPVPFANVYLEGTTLGTASDENGDFSKNISISANEKLTIAINLEASSEQLEETVVTGTLKAVSRSESPVPVEVYSPTFLKKNPTASIFEALQNVNGVRPQINCNVCNTGDIHINGLEGPYTLVLIDGMPIVSGLGTVYGLSGIPNSLIEQIEIVKGPACWRTHKYHYQKHTRSS